LNCVDQGGPLIEPDWYDAPANCRSRQFTSKLFPFLSPTHCTAGRRERQTTDSDHR